MPPKKPAKPFVETNEVQDAVANSAPKKPVAKHTHDRTSLNHATDNSLSIDGMNFRKTRGLLDGTTKRTLDIRKDLLNPELEYYWCNDEKGLVDQRVELGYQVVPEIHSKTGEKISTRRRVGTKKDGSELSAVLMATPKIWKKERQDAQDKQRQALESGLIAGSTDGKESLGKDFYTKEGTHID